MMMSSQSRFLFAGISLAIVHRDRGMGLLAAYSSVNVLFSSHVMMGRLRRSLYVGRSTEYLFLFAVGAILEVGCCELGK